MTHVHNPDIRYFCQILAHTIFGREKKSRIIAKELFYIHSVFTLTWVNSSLFMLVHMQVVHTTNKGPIYFRGVITSIAHALGLEMDISKLDPLPIPSLDIDACCHIRLIKNKRDERYSLMIGNREVPSIILPFPNCTDVKIRVDWIYNLNVDTKAKSVPIDIPENVAANGATDDEFDHRE